MNHRKVIIMFKIQIEVLLSYLDAWKCYRHSKRKSRSRHQRSANMGNSSKKPVEKEEAAVKPAKTVKAIKKPKRNKRQTPFDSNSSARNQSASRNSESILEVNAQDGASDPSTSSTAMSVELTPMMSSRKRKPKQSANMNESNSKRRRKRQIDGSSVNSNVNKRRRKQ